MTKRFLVGIVAVLACGLPVRASVVSYCNSASPACTNNSAAFSSAGLVNIDFTSAAIVSNSFTDPLSMTAFYDYLGGTESEIAGVLSDSKGGFQINVPANTLVFALNFQTANTVSYLVTFNTDGGSTLSSYTLTGNGSPQFFGATTTTAVSNLLVYAGGGQHVGSITNFELQGSGGSQTPEVGTLLLIGTGLIAMRWMRRAPLRVFRTLRTA